MNISQKYFNDIIIPKITVIADSFFMVKIYIVMLHLKVKINKKHPVNSMNLQDILQLTKFLI